MALQKKTLKILHLSDIHWHKEAEIDFRIVRDALLTDLTDLGVCEKQGAFDLFLFSGDLVRGGENYEDFKSAFTEMLMPILDHLQLTQKQLVICAGNHDISRKVVRESQIIESGLKASMGSVEQINKFIDGLNSGSSINKMSLDRMSNYEKFLSEIGYTSDHVSDLFHIKNIEICGKTISVASINNSWRSSGESGGVDRGKLIMGERVVDHCADLTASADFRIAMFHHPLDWLVGADASCVSPRLFNSFDLIAYGHVHEVQPELRVSPSGSSIISQSGALYAGRSYFNGYQIIEIDLGTCEATVNMRSYFNAPARRFGAAENIVQGGKIVLSYEPRAKNSRPDLERFLREVRGNIRDQALNQFNVSDLGAEIGSDPHTAFICPPIFTRDGTEDIGESDGQTESPQIPSQKEIEISLVDILRGNKNFLFVGAREGGKSSLANFVAVQISDGNADRPRVPILIDYRNFSPNLYGLKKAGSTYLRITKSGFDIEAGLNAGDIVILLDNFSGIDIKKLHQLEELIRAYPRCRWLAFADARYGATNPDVAGNDLFEGAEIARLERLPRKSIRELTRRWCAKTGADGEATYSAVMKQIKEGDLPRNGYIVTLLLWAIAQNKKFESINESVLIMNMADFLLGKADFTKSLRGEFDATSKEITLQRIAGFIRTQNGIVTHNKLAVKLVEFFEEMGLNYDASDVIASLVRCGILKRFDNDISFKYRCFEEYFEARRIGSSEKNFKGAMYNREYLKNVRQIELFSGISRQNESIIQELLLELEFYAPEDIKSIDILEFDEVVQEASNIGMTELKLHRIQKKKLTAEQIDDLVDAAEARLTNRKSRRKNEAIRGKNGQTGSNSAFGTTPLQPPNSTLKPIEFMMTLDLLGKVLVNSEFTPKDLKVKGGLAFLDGSTRVFLRLNALIQEVLADAIEDIKASDPDLDDKSIQGLKYLMTRKILGITSERVSNTFSSPKLAAVYDEILRDSEIGLGDRALLTATLLDAGYEAWNEKWIEISKAKPTRRLLIEFLTDKLWDFMHRKVMDAKLRDKVETTAVELRVALAGNDAAKSIIARNVKRDTDKAMKDGKSAD